MCKVFPSDLSPAPGTGSSGYNRVLHKRNIQDEQSLGKRKKKKINDLGHHMVVKHKMVVVGGKTFTSH